MNPIPPKTIFVFAYYSYKDPVFQSAVLPYFENLAINKDLRFVLLTFEQQKYKLNKDEVERITNELLKHNIFWYKTYWHSGSFKILKKIFDFCWGILLSAYLILKYRVGAIYSEAFPGAIIGYHLAKWFNIPHMVHSFEPHTDYMVESGVWKENDWEAKLLRKYEVKIALHASHIFTATDAMIQRFHLLGVKGKIHRVPSCVDLEVFKYSLRDRNLIRDKFRISEDYCLITYLGKFGGMYMEEEIFDFFHVCERNEFLKCRFFIITPDPHELVLSYINKKGLQREKYSIMTLTRKEISPFLSASDFGLVPVRQKPGKRFCSPIKDGEYWACGLPIIIPEGISDDFIFAKEKSIGIVMENTSISAYESVVQELAEWKKSNKKEDVIDRCRAFVESDRSVSTYKELFRKVFLRF